MNTLRRPRKPRLTPKRIRGLLVLLHHADTKLFQPAAKSDRDCMATACTWIEQTNNWHTTRTGSSASADQENTTP